MSRAKIHVTSKGRRKLPPHRDEQTRGDGGFSIVEVVLALALLILIATSIEFGVTASVSATTLARYHSEAASLLSQVDAQLEVEIPSQTSYANAATYVQTYVSGISVTSISNGPQTKSTTYHVSATTASLGGDLMSVTVTVSYSSTAGQTNLVTATSYVEYL